MCAYDIHMHLIIRVRFDDCMHARSNMNVNEVLAFRATQILREEFVLRLKQAARDSCSTKCQGATETEEGKETETETETGLQADKARIKSLHVHPNDDVNMSQVNSTYDSFVCTHTHTYIARNTCIYIQTYMYV